MITTLRGVAMLLVALALTLMAHAQQFRPLSADFAVTYTLERSKVASVDCGCFWLFGGSLDAAVPLFHGLGAAAILTGGHATNITPGSDLGKIAYMFGPRYSFNTARWTSRFPGSKHPASVFGEALFGSAHGFDSAFPTSSGIQSSANALSMQFGGGFNIGMARGFGFRAIELEYGRTTFRNLASNTQNDLRISFGITYHVGER